MSGDTTLPLRHFDHFDWVGAVAEPDGDGWTGGVALNIDPHPLSLGREVWRVTQADVPAEAWGFHLQDGWRLQEGHECSIACEPHRVRWVYVLSDDDVFTVLVGACFRSGPGMVSGEHHFRHVAVFSTSIDSAEPDWLRIVRLGLEVKAGPDHCPYQRFGV